MFLSSKKKLTNNVRHRKQLMWHEFAKKTLKENHKRWNFNKFNEEKLTSYFCKGFYFNNFNKKIYNIISDKSNNNILTFCKYGSEIGSIYNNIKYESFINLNYSFLNFSKNILVFLKPGYFIHNIYVHNSNNKISFSEGTFSIILKHLYDLNITQIKLPSGNLKHISMLSEVYFGRGGNIFKKHVVWGSWGYKYKFKNHNPVVRGVAMNPVDHPNGGRTKVKKPFKNKYNKIAKKGK